MHLLHPIIILVLQTGIPFGFSCQQQLFQNSVFRRLWSVASSTSSSSFTKCLRSARQCCLMSSRFLSREDCRRFSKVGSLATSIFTTVQNVSQSCLKCYTKQNNDVSIVDSHNFKDQINKKNKTFNLFLEFIHSFIRNDYTLQLQQTI